MVDDQAQEGRRGQEARQALHQAVAGDHRRRQGGRPRPGRERLAGGRDRQGTVVLDAEGQHRAGRAARRRQRRGHRRVRRDHVRGLRPRGRRHHRGGADRQPQPHRRRRARDLQQAQRQPRHAGLGGVAVRAQGRGAGVVRPAGRGRDGAAGGRCRRRGRAAGRRCLAGDHRRGRPGGRAGRARGVRHADQLGRADPGAQEHGCAGGGRCPQAAAPDRRARGQRRRAGRLRQLRHP